MIELNQESIDAAGGNVMLLSFSVPDMLPWIRAGIRQAKGEPVSGRVKRQTIRRRGPRADALLKHAEQASWTHGYDLHLWWKSRTPERESLGVVEGGSWVYPITILHSSIELPGQEPYPCLRIDGPRGWRQGDAALFWSPGNPPGPFLAEAMADGFDTVESFRDYFVPNQGDVFEGVLFKW